MELMLCDVRTLIWESSGVLLDCSACPLRERCGIREEELKQ